MFISMKKWEDEALTKQNNLVHEGRGQEGDPLIYIAWSTPRHPAIGMPASRETMCVSFSTMTNISMM
jgi:hypothetical protein